MPNILHLANRRLVAVMSTFAIDNGQQTTLTPRFLEGRDPWRDWIVISHLPTTLIHD